MSILAWMNPSFGGRKGRRLDEVRFEMPEPQPAADGDMRGAYGFGRRAHRPDPGGRFGFQNDANYWVRHPRG